MIGQPVPGSAGKIEKLTEAPIIPHLELLEPRLPSAKPAKKAVNPTTNHLCRSKGWKRAIFIRFHAPPSGAKKAMLSIFVPSRDLSILYLPHKYCAKTRGKILSPGIYNIFPLKITN